MNLLDFIFPKRCVNCKKIGEYVCPSCFTRLSFDVQLVCFVCNRNSINGLTHPACKTKYTIDGAFCGLAYGVIVRKLIYAFKYRPYVSDLQHFLTDLLYESLIQQQLFMETIVRPDTVFVPIPLSTLKYKKRGYNQAKILVTGIAKKFNLLVIDCLERTKETKPQFGLNRQQRIENMKDAFILKKDMKDLKFTNVFLVDDILTSGSTLLEAARY